MHTEILTPSEKAAEKSRQIIKPRNAEHAALMEKQDREIHLEYLQKLKRVIVL